MSWDEADFEVLKRIGVYLGDVPTELCGIQEALREMLPVTRDLWLGSALQGILANPTITPSAENASEHARTAIAVVGALIALLDKEQA